MKFLGERIRGLDTDRQTLDGASKLGHPMLKIHLKSVGYLGQIKEIIHLCNFSFYYDLY